MDQEQNLGELPLEVVAMLTIYHSEFSRHIEYDFFKEDHKNNIHSKN